MADEKKEKKRKKLGIWIPNVEIFNKFISKVAEKHGQTYGKTGDELINAIILWLEYEERGGEDLSLRDTHTHTHAPKHRPRKTKIAEKDVMYGKAYPLTSRERRLRQIGTILFSTQTSEVLEGKNNFVVSDKGMEKIIVSQKISENRVIKDYIHAMEVKGWIQKIPKSSLYAILANVISDDLGLEFPEGYLQKTLNAEKEERLNGNNHLTL